MAAWWMERAQVKEETGLGNDDNGIRCVVQLDTADDFFRNAKTVAMPLCGLIQESTDKEDSYSKSSLDYLDAFLRFVRYDSEEFKDQVALTLSGFIATMLMEKYGGEWGVADIGDPGVSLLGQLYLFPFDIADDIISHPSLTITKLVRLLDHLVDLHSECGDGDLLGQLDRLPERLATWTDDEFVYFALNSSGQICAMERGFRSHQ